MAGSSSITRMRTSPAVYMRPPSSGIACSSAGSSSRGVVRTSVLVFSMRHQGLLGFGPRQGLLDGGEERRRLQGPAQQLKARGQIVVGQAVERGLGANKQQIHVG